MAATPEPASLALAWWGNPTRNKNTHAAIDAYIKANSGVKIAGPAGRVRTATGTSWPPRPPAAPLPTSSRWTWPTSAEYGNRGALLDLCKVDTSKFVEGTVDSGKINDTLVGVNAGINSLIIMANPSSVREGQDGHARRQDLDLGLA